jgi:hypothetical protein
LTYFEAVGPCGVVDESGAPYAVFEVLEAVGGYAGAEVLDVELTEPLTVEAIALRDGLRYLVLVANITPEQRTARVAVPSGETRRVDLGPYQVERIDVG